MITLGIVVVIVCFLYLSLLALLRAGRQRREQIKPAYKKLPRVSLEVIKNFGNEFKKLQNQAKSQKATDEIIAEIKREQPFLFTMLAETSRQMGDESYQTLTLGVVVYKLLKAQVEVDLLDNSLSQPRH